MDDGRDLGLELREHFRQYIPMPDLDEFHVSRDIYQIVQRVE
jgi:hypothetical protein